MKRVICFLLFVTMVSMYLLPANAQVRDGWDFEQIGDIDGFTTTCLPSGNPSAADVRMKDGRLLLFFDSKGVSGSAGRRIVRAETVNTYEADSFVAVYFSLEINEDSAPRNIGFSADVDVPIITASGTDLSILNTDTVRLSPNEEHDICLIVGEKTIVAVDGIVYKYEGRILDKDMSYKFYFNSVDRNGNIVSETYIDDLYIYRGGSYSFQSSVRDGETLTGLDEIEFSFGMPLVKTPQISISSDDETILAESEFLYDSLRVYKDGGFEKNRSYSVKVSGIQTADGDDAEDIEISFRIAPEGYIPPSISLVGLPDSVREGDTVSVQLNINSQYPLAETYIFVNGAANEVRGSMWDYTFDKSGEYVIYAYVRDSIGGEGESEEIRINVIENIPPVIEMQKLSGEILPEKLSSLRFRITDDVSVADAKFFINDTDVTHLCKKEGDLYTVSNFPVSIGDMKIEVDASDSNGAHSVLSEIVQVSAGEMRENVIFQTGFTDGATGLNYTTDAMDTSVIDLNGNKVFSIVQQGAAGGGNTQIQLNANTTELIGASMDFYIPNSLEGVQFSEVMRGAGPTEWPASYRVDSTGLTVYDVSGNVAAKQMIQPDTWYTVKSCVDPASGRFWIWFNNEMITPAEGCRTTALASKTIVTMREEFRGTAPVYVDNVKLISYIKCPQIIDASSNGETVNIYLDSRFYSKKFDNAASAVELWANGQKAELESVVYDDDAMRIKITAATSLSSASEYRIILPVGIAYGASSQTEYPMVKYFKTASARFDVTKVEFTQRGGFVGAHAFVHNEETEERSVVMVMTEKSPNGAVEHVFSSETVTVGRGETKELSIPASVLAENTAEIFFIENWDTCIPVKAAIYRR